jgi:hypothetical protein
VPGLGLLCEDGSIRLGTGAYQNSKGRGTIYAMAGWMPLSYGPVNIGIAAGMATGYDIPVAPIGGLSLQYRFDWGSIYTMAMPRTYRSPAVLALSITISI